MLTPKATDPSLHYHADCKREDVSVIGIPLSNKRPLQMQRWSTLLSKPTLAFLQPDVGEQANALPGTPPDEWQYLLLLKLTSCYKLQMGSIQKFLPEHHQILSDNSDSNESQYATVCQWREHVVHSQNPPNTWQGSNYKKTTAKGRTRKSTPKTLKHHQIISKTSNPKK